MSVLAKLAELGRLGDDPAIIVPGLLRQAVAVLSLLMLPRTLLDVITTPYSTTTVAGLWLCVISQILVISAGLLPIDLVWPVAVTATLGALVAALGMFPEHLHPEQVRWEFSLWLWTPLLFLIVGHPRRLAWLPVAGVAFAGSALAILRHHEIVDEILYGIVFTFSPIATFAIAGRAARSTLSDVFTRQQEYDKRREADQVIQILAAERHRQISATHDDLLNLLQQAASQHRAGSDERIRSLAQTAKSNLSEQAATSQKAPLTSLRELLSEHLEGVRCRLLGGECDLQVPPETAEAIAQATREAARNATKHAPGSPILVTITRSGYGVRVTIEDYGQGFDPSLIPSDRLGVSESIFGRMAGIGGHAQITSSAAGTTVTLHWNTETLVTQSEMSDETLRVVSLLPIPVTVSSLLHLLILYGWEWPLHVFATWLTAMATITWCLLRLRERRLSTPEIITFSLLSLAGIIANYAWIDPAVEDPHLVWTTTLAGALLLLIIPGSLLRQAIPLVAAMITVTLVASVTFLGWGATLTTYNSALIATIMSGTVTALLSLGYSASAARLRHTRRLEAEAILSAHLSAQRDQLRHDWVFRLNELVEPLLGELASGAADLSDPQTARRARLTEARIRDELRLWPSSSGLADALDQLRRQGWQCHLAVPGISGADASFLANELVTLPPPNQEQSLRITQRNGGYLVTITNPALTAEQLRGVSKKPTLLQDSDFTQLKYSISEPGPGRSVAI